MKETLLSTALVIVATSAVIAQIINPKVTNSLNRFYPAWKPAPGTCDKRRWFLTGDFDGDGTRDYLVRVKTGKTAKSMRLNLIAFFGSEDGKYPAKQILDDAYKGDLLRSSF